VAYAREGAQIYDGHQAGQVLVTLKRAKIRGVDSYSMACSEKELGISDEHEGIILLDDDAVPGTPLADYMGDAVLDIAITPNIARDANILGVAREVAALTGKPLKTPGFAIDTDGPPVTGMATIVIQQPELNPRFVLGLITGVEIKPSPYWVQRLLRLSGVRPINNIVDATNYAMLEVGEPLHAFDYDVLVRRAGTRPPRIITRTARQGESLTTLDGVERSLNDYTVLVCDSAGPLSIAGVMGGAESEVTENTRNILLEGAAWNYINIRKTVTAQRLPSEAAYRFSRGVHPAMAERGVRRGLLWMRQWAGGTIYQGLVDSYPLPPFDPVVDVRPADVQRWLGIELSAEQIAAVLSALDFSCVHVNVGGEPAVRATTPDHRLDIGEGVIGVADLMEEIARVYGYERIPSTRLSDELPPQRSNPSLEREEAVRDMLVNLGLQEVATYRMTSSEREARRLPPETPIVDEPYVRLANPIVSDRNLMRRSLLSSVLEVVERNSRLQTRMAFFEIAPVFLPEGGDSLPLEQQRLVIVITGSRSLTSWQASDSGLMDFYDLKGIVNAILEGLHLQKIRYEAFEHPSFHPGKTSRVFVDDLEAGLLGELHPLVHQNYEIPAAPLLAADFNLDILLAAVPSRYDVTAVPTFPPVLEDMAVIVDEAISAERVEETLRQAGGNTLVNLRLFDVYRGEQIGQGLKSLAYSLTYQAPDRTLTDQEATQIRQRIVHRLHQDLNARLRS
jgi:phenylalanyl-tRNA synthetase beta chain